MKYVLVTVWSGVIDQVIFFNDESKAIKELSEYVKSMDFERCDAAVFGHGGMKANAKDFLDDNDRYSDNIIEVLARTNRTKQPTIKE